MDYATDKKQDKTAVRLDKGDAVIEPLRQVAEKVKITSGQIAGIGAVKEPVIGYYQIESHEYKKDRLAGAYELTNLTGVVAKKEQDTHIHAHVTLADESHRAFGGHLHQATVSAAGEFWIYHSDTPITRNYNGSLGLDLMRFSSYDESQQ